MIVPAAGCQCLGYRSGTLEVIAGPASPDAWREHPHRGGIPILFPWPGRIAGARFTFKGREYRLPVNEPARGHAIHGFACERAFRVTRRGPDFGHGDSRFFRLSGAQFDLAVAVRARNRLPSW